MDAKNHFRTNVLSRLVKPAAQTLFTMGILLSFSCREDQQKAEISPASLTDNLPTYTQDQTPVVQKQTNSQSLLNAEKNNEDDHKVDELALDLKLLNEKWSTLDFAKNRIRVEGYVIDARMLTTKDINECVVKLAYYPHASITTLADQFDTKILSLHFEKNLYGDDETCKDLNKKKISVIAHHPLTGAFAAFVDEEILAKDDADQDFKDFYPNLLEHKYPNIKISDMTEVDKQEQSKRHMIYTKISASVDSGSFCKLSVGTESVGDYILIDYSKQDDRNLSDSKIDKESCAKLSTTKALLGVGYKSKTTENKDVDLDSYYFTDQLDWSSKAE